MPCKRNHTTPQGYGLAAIQESGTLISFSPRPASSQRRLRRDGFRAAGWQSALQLAAATLAPAFGASGRAVRLPADVTVEAVLATRCNNRPAGATIRHLPSGMSCGGTIALTREGLGYQVRVNWLTGGVEVVPIN